VNSKTVWARRYATASGTVVLVLVGYLMIQQPILRETARENQARSQEAVRIANIAEQNAKTASKDAKKAQDAVKLANGRLASEGLPTVPVPTITPPVPIPTAVPLPDRFTIEEQVAVQVMISAEIAKLDLRLSTTELAQLARVAADIAVSKIPRPKDGKTPTLAELKPLVDAAVATRCAGDKCRGPAAIPTPGPSGPPGKQGERGATGEQGPRVTDAELRAQVEATLAVMLEKAVADAVAQYCASAEKPCQGLRGAAGEEVVSFGCVALASGTVIRLVTRPAGSEDTITADVEAVCVPPSARPK
jgi:hypothetical protein